MPSCIPQKNPVKTPVLFLLLFPFYAPYRLFQSSFSIDQSRFTRAYCFSVRYKHYKTLTRPLDVLSYCLLHKSGSSWPMSSKSNNASALKLQFDNKQNINKYSVCPETGELHFSKHCGESKILGFWGAGELYMGLYIRLTIKI